MIRMRGQALVEALALLLVLVPLWWMVQALGFALEEQAALRESTRLSAFEARTLQAADLRVGVDAVLELEGRQRSPAGTPIDARRSTESLPGEGGRVLASVLSSLSPVTALSRGRSDWPRAGWQRLTAELPLLWPETLRVAPLPRELRLRHDIALLADDGSARDPRHVHARVDALVPSVPLRALALPLANGVVRPVIELLEPSIAELCVGRIDPELLPADRLGAPSPRPRPAVPQWRPPC